MSGCDDPGLWARMKTMKEDLFENGHFATKYRQTFPKSAIQTSFKHSPNPESSLKVPETKESPVTGERTLEDKQNTEVGNNFDTTSDAISLGLKVKEPSSPEMSLNSKPNDHHLTPSSPVSTDRSRISLKSQQNRYFPCITLTLKEALLRAPGRAFHNSEAIPSTSRQSVTQKGVVQYRAHIPSPLANEVSAASSSTAPRDIIPPGHREAQVKMSETDGSDEILLHHRGKTRAKNTKAQGGESFSRVASHQSTEPLPGPAEQKISHNKDKLRVSQISEQGSEDLHKGVAIPTHDQSKVASAQNENRRDYLLEEEADELNRLRREIVANAHRNRFGNDSPTASPELLVKCRDGPGADRHSEVYREITNFRQVSQDCGPDDRYIPGSSHVFSTEAADDAKPEVLVNDLKSRMKVYRDLYKKSPTYYPTLTDEGTLISSSIPNAGQKKLLAKIRTPVLKTRPEQKRTIRIFENSWTDGVRADWEYAPRCINNTDLYRAHFQRWLESTIKLGCPVDIFHQAFLDGKAHADGETMFMLNMRNYDTELDPNDGEGQLHAYETAAGYSYNFIWHRRMAEEEEERKKNIERRIRLEARQSPPLRSPHSPTANIYLRPVDTKDIPELRDIFNWYAKNSIISPLTDDLESEEVGQRIETCRNAKLPFIVAIDRRTASTRDTEKVLGYAVAKDFGDSQTATRYTAELELYVRDGHQNQGIGKCLLDKLLEVCDPTYTPKSGYLFDAKTELRSAYFPGGIRRLKRLLFALSYVDNCEISVHKRVKRWLAEHAEFEEQGLLRGVRVKFDKYVNVSYLVRNAYNTSDKPE